MADRYTEQEVKDFCEYLNQTLIPDLHESNMVETAKDFETCVAIIFDLNRRLRESRQPSRTR